MQKKLIALAIAGLSSAAFAQSNVTVYGVADAAVQKTTGTSTAASANGTANNGNSRLGFKGSEDLGGGLAANFVIEQGINIATGATSANTWDRSAWVGLSGGFGALQVGRNYTVGFHSVAAYELTGAANYSALVNTFGAPGGIRNDAQIRYNSPNFNGFAFAIDHVLKGNVAAGAGPAETGLSATYANGPLVVSFAHSDNGNGSKDNALGGSYNFGMGRAVLSFQDPNGVSKGWTLGVGEVKAGPVLLTLDYARNTGSDLSKLMFEGKYPMSKRTFAYMAVVKNNNPDGTADTTMTSLGMRHNF